jgi:hypothetical protein
MRREWLLAAAASVFLALLWLYIYPGLSLRLRVPELAPLHQVIRFRFIPVIRDTGSLVEISGAITFAALPLYLVARRELRRREALEQQVAELLSLYAGLLASTGSAADALLVASRILDPPMSIIVEKMARIYRATGDLEKAFREAFRDTPRRVRIYAYSIVSATKSRGMMHRVLGVASSHAQSTRRLLSLVKSRLSEYGFVTSLASITYAFSAGIVIGLVEKMSTMSMPMFGRPVDPGILLGLYYYSLLAIIAASAFIVARIVHGYTPMAAKYIALLTLTDTLIMVLSPRILL